MGGGTTPERMTTRGEIRCSRYGPPMDGNDVR